MAHDVTPGGLVADDRAEYERRLVAVRAAMSRAGFDAIVAVDSGDWLPPTGNARYLSNFNIGNMVNVMSGVAVVVPLREEPTLVVPRGRSAASRSGRARPRGSRGFRAAQPRAGRWGRPLTAMSSSPSRNRGSSARGSDSAARSRGRRISRPSCRSRTSRLPSTSTVVGQRGISWTESAA